MARKSILELSFLRKLKLYTSVVFTRFAEGYVHCHVVCIRERLRYFNNNRWRYSVCKQGIHQVPISVRLESELTHYATWSLRAEQSIS
jgi:hypothetical protein